jgi:hypothetical protein
MTIHKLKQNSITILLQIANFVKQIDDQHYSEKLPLLSNNTVAKHIRHILELYVQLLSGIKHNEINYDKRERNLLIEHDKNYTMDFINQLIEKINEVQDASMDIHLNSLIDKEEVLVKTSIEREFVYNIEHAIHHMAILQIASKHYFDYMNLEENFGIAYSTIQYNNTCAQ